MSATPRISTTGPARRQLPLLVLSFVLLIAAVYADPLFFRKNFAGRDILGYNLPIEKSIHEAYRRGRLPVWIDEISGGRPLLPNPNGGALYPVRPALAVLPFPLAMRIYPVLHWGLAGAGMILLLTAIGLSQGAAWMGAVTYVFSGVSVSEVIYTNYQPGMALLPWTIWLSLRASRGPIGRVRPLALAFGLLFLAGDVVTSGMALGACLLWAATELSAGERRRFLPRLAAAAGLGALLALPQIVATALWIPHTTRSVLGMKVFEALAYSVSPWRLVELAVPYPFGPTGSLEMGRIWGQGVFQGRLVGFFATFYCGAFALIALIEARRLKTSGVRFARILLVLVLAATVPPILLAQYFPNAAFLVPLRYPEKLAVAGVLALAVLSGVAVEGLGGGPLRLRRWTLVMAVALASVALTAVVLPEPVGRAALALTGREGLRETAVGQEIAGAFAEGGLLWCATLLAAAGLPASRRAVKILALAALTAVPLVANRRIAQSYREEEVFAPPAFYRFVQRYDPANRYRVLGESLYRPPSKAEEAKTHADPGNIRAVQRNWDQYTGALWGRGAVFNGDFDHGDLSRFDSLRKLSFVAATYGDSDSFWATYSLRWGVRYPDQLPLAGYRPLGGDGFQVWDENPRALPDIRLPASWREVPGAIDASRSVAQIPAEEVLLETGSERTGQARIGRLRVSEKTDERLRITSEAPDPSWLFVLRGYWPYRKVRVDGREAEVVPAQIAFSAVALPAGRHTIEWVEQVPGLSVSRWGPLLFLAGCAALRRRRGEYPNA